MTCLTVAGGVYHELSVWPEWNQVFGSGGRAAAAAQGHVPSVRLHCYAQGDVAHRLQALSKQFDFRPHVTQAQQTISFAYVHSLAVPAIRPTPTLIQQHDAILVAADVVLRFGMMEGSAQVDADYCTYDPQSALVFRL